MPSSLFLLRIKPIAFMAFYTISIFNSAMLYAGDLQLDLSEKHIHQKSEKFLLKTVKEEHFMGVSLVMRSGKVIHASAYGKATDTASNELDTVFHIASVTKQFTAAAVLQLVEQGKIDLNLSINEYLPAKYKSPNWDIVFVRHVMSHTSGVPDYEETRDYYNVVDGFCLGDTVDGMVREAMSKELDFEPGTSFQYSNIGFSLLGLIIEEQSGEKYADYMKKHIFSPLGMDRSRIHEEGHMPSLNEASGFRWNDALGHHTKDNLITLPVTEPDGGMLTTLSDFVKWTQIYKTGQHSILSKNSIEKMTTPSFPFGSYKVWRDDSHNRPYSYGYGLLVGEDQIGHEGYIVGFRSHFIYDRDQDLLVVVFTNNTTNDPYQIASGLFNIHDTAQSQ